MMKKILLLLPALLALVSCNGDSKEDWGGMEYFTFGISGKVTDSSGNPIEGISVSALGTETFTKADGKYVLEGQGGADTSVFLSVSDKDGADNGGRYMSATRKVELQYVNGKHGPYLGHFSGTDVNVVLSVGLTPVPDTDIPLQ